MEEELKVPGLISGTFHHALDPKSRLTIPSQWRAILGGVGSLYVLPDTDDPHLRIIPGSYLLNVTARAQKYTLRDRDLGQSLRLFFANLEQVDVDVQGRIRISDRLLAFAKLSGTVTLVGYSHFFEVWSAERWPEQEKVSEEDVSEAVDVVDGLLL